MTGTREHSATARIRLSPPRGMHRSTSSVRESNWGMAARSVVGTTWMASAGKAGRALAADSTMIFAIAWFEWSASLPPRRMVALPDLKQRLAASAVTFGRDS